MSRSSPARTAPGSSPLPATVPLLLLLLAGSGCRAEGYFGDRVRDLAQCLDVDGSLGGGFRAWGGASGVVQLGVGWSSTAAAGLRDGEPATWREDRSELGIGPFYLHEVDLEGASNGLVGHRTARFGEPGFVSVPVEYWGGVWADRSPGDLGASAHLFLAGLSARIRLVEIFDFFAGLATLDPRGDDLAGRSIPDLLADLRSPDARKRSRADRGLRILTGRGSAYRTYSDPDHLTAEQSEAAAAWEEALAERQGPPREPGP